MSRLRTLSFIGLFGLFALAALAAPALAQVVERQAAAVAPAAVRCLYLPLVLGRGGAQATAAGPAPADEHCAGTGVAGALRGNLRLRPESGVILTTDTAPRQIVVVLDVSGSMSANFAGQCNSRGQLIQCANGPAGAPPSQQSSLGSLDWWNPQEERRIYVAKNSIKRLIDQLNLPGNPDYTASRPLDEVALVWFNDRQSVTMIAEWSSDAGALKSVVESAGAVAGDPYRASGGTNGAAGLYRASLLFKARPAGVEYNGQQYSYARQAFFVTDGVSNSFLDTNRDNLWGGSSGINTYAFGNACRQVLLLAENAPCMTTEIGGLYNGFDRPITQMVNVSRNELIDAGIPVVDVLAISPVPVTGLRNGVATTEANFYQAATLQVYPDGRSNVDQFIDKVLAKAPGPVCRASASRWTGTIGAGRAPLGTGLPAGSYGEVVLTASSGATISAPVTIDPATSALSFQLADVPPGRYDLSARVYYRGDDGVTRAYNQLYSQENASPTIAIERDSSARQDLGQLSLIVGDQPCSTP